MPINSYKLGDGTLILTPSGGPAFDMSLQVTGVKVTPTETVQTGDTVKVLGGGELAGAETASYARRLSGNVIQDIDLAGNVAWSWTHEGEEVDFQFVPSTAEGVECTGVVRVVGLELGGDEVGQRPRSDFDWACIGKPDLSAVV